MARKPFNGYVLVENGEISGLGRGKYTGRGERIKGNLISPGFVNAHVHTGMFYFRGKGSGLPFNEWLEKIIFPLEKKITRRQIYLGALRACKSMIDSGTTSFCNINPWYKPVVRAVRKTGMRAKLALSLKDQGTPYKPPVGENVSLVKRYRSGRIEGMFGLANEKECSAELIARVAALAEKYDSGIHVHIAESPLGEQMIERKYGKTSIQYFNSLGALNEKTIAVHCVNISDRDVSVLRRSGASVVHCPTTNLLVHVGISPVRKLLAGGVGVNLGTDEPVANPTMDVRREAVMAKKLHRLPTERIFRMLTDGRLFGSAVGEIAVGKSADLVVSDARSLEELVFGRAETMATIVDGNILKG